MRKLLLFFVCLISVSPGILQAQEEEMGEPLESQNYNNIGVFDFPGVSCKPLGVAYLSGKEYPDLFLASDKWNPGFFYYEFAGFSQKGVPVFLEAKEFKTPATYKNLGCVKEIGGKIYGFWYIDKKIVSCVFDSKSFEFKREKELAVSFPRNPGPFSVEINQKGNYVFVFSIGDGVNTRAPGDGRDADYIPYRPDGVYNGGISYSDLYKVEVANDFNSVVTEATKISKGDVKVRSSHQGITKIEVNDNREGLVTGSWFGNLYFFELSKDFDVQEEGIVSGADLITLRHPTIWPTPLVYPGTDRKWNNLIASGEGGIYFYKYLGFSEKRNAPIYDTPQHLLKQNSNLKGGSLVVPTMVDWDGDGKTDIVAGNSLGQILFFRNLGDNQTPQFSAGVPLEAGGKEIHIQPGYGEDIQGPFESRWGYTCPNVIDWNDDGVYDIVMGDSRGKHTVYINKGTPQKPELAEEHPIYLEGLELHGTWRCKPGVAKIGDKMAYVTLDDDDVFHLYWQIDAYNLKEGFKLCLEDGTPIEGNFLEAGGTGRLKFNIVDWDLDGTLDLIVGTPRHGCVPNPKEGLPWRYLDEGRPGSAVLFLKNVGTDESPKYHFPKLLRYKGKPIYLGQHSCAPTPWYRNSKTIPDILVGRENGMFYYFDRKDISW
ncbi:FG-GAP repeat domain-containing protein [Maribellus maritimus]|uniref:FG-GAP repeat domain-containing protein n=1 Tax=Maribellus maritimus TaxID=2870838 RepID=UPI001EEAC704|nr:VCBS repeat-containing protein [Maribellus maritimus]MCG6190128.1 VCBS repeat-containing protein [Maribellus maritimus]